MKGSNVEHSIFEYRRPIPDESIIKEVYDVPTHRKGTRGNFRYDCTHAVDLLCETGTPASPMLWGRVYRVHRMKEEKTWRSLFDPPRGFFEHKDDANGNFIVIAHLDGNLRENSVYSHLSKILVDEGDIVSEDDVIGETGDTGQSLKPHIHNEVGYFKDKDTWITRMIRWRK